MSEHDGEKNEKQPSPPKLGLISVYQKEASVSDVEFDRIAVTDGGSLVLLSVMAETQKVKALRALLSRSSGRPGIQAAGVFMNRPGDPSWEKRAAGNINMQKDQEGYTFYTHRLGYGMAHMLVLSKARGFMAVADETAIWNEIKDSRFTTPVVPEWLPYIKEELTNRKLLHWCRAYRAECGMLLCSTEHLDSIVSDGIKSGRIHIPSGDPAVIDTELAESRMLPAPAEVA